MSRELLKEFSLFQLLKELSKTDPGYFSALSRLSCFPFNVLQY
jgi:hypothetical protein